MEARVIDPMDRTDRTAVPIPKDLADEIAHSLDYYKRYPIRLRKDWPYSVIRERVMNPVNTVIGCLTPTRHLREQTINWFTEWLMR